MESNKLMYTAEVDQAPAYELAISFQTYLCRSVHKTLELGSAWASAVEQQLPQQTVATLAQVGRDVADFPFDLLIWQCPEPRDYAGFLHWLQVLPVDELAALVRRYRPTAAASARVFGAQRDEYVQLLTAWYDGYFCHLEAPLLANLARLAADDRMRLAHLPAEAAVEEATHGIYQADEPGLARVVLIPQHHFRPWSYQGRYQGVYFYLYPVAVMSVASESPPAQLMRLTRALGDENRLRILRFVAGERRSFSEVVRFTGLAKSTVHHHLAVLRAAGLLRVHGGGVDVDGYSLRPGALQCITAQLGSFLQGEGV